MPDPKIPGFKFPQAEAAILKWVEKDDQKAINSHAWGIWTGLTLGSGETYAGQELLVFETWLTPSDIKTATVPATELLTLPQPRNPRPLTVPNQLTHAGLKATEGRETVLGFVKYDPVATDHVQKNDLFDAATLKGMLPAPDAQAKIPDFPFAAVVLKPVFVPMKKLVDGRYYKLAAWPGPPPTPGPYPAKDWGQCVWVDTEPSSDQDQGKGDVDKTCSNTSRTPETTYSVEEFIHFVMTAEEAAALDDPQVAVGDTTILHGMHVSTRELTRWTWQTFW